MKQKWLELTCPQQILILIQGFLILLFWILYLTVGQQQAIEYRGEHLRLRTDGSTATYSGKLDGEKAVFTITGDTVEYRLGDTSYGPYTVTETSATLPDEGDKPIYITSLHTLKGVEVREGPDLLFRGFYTKTPFLLYDESGEPLPPVSIISNAVTVETGNGLMLTYVKDSCPSYSEVIELALVPDLSQRGYAGGFALGVLLCIACSISVLYADNLFRWNLRFQIRNAERAEPSDWELFSRWIGWIALTVCALILFILSINYAH